MNFSKRFRDLRQKKHLTQDQLLLIFNKKYKRSFTTAAISQYENGKRIPEIDALIDFADFFDVTLDYLMGIDKKTDAFDISELNYESKNDLKKYFELLKLKEMKERNDGNKQSGRTKLSE